MHEGMGDTAPIGWVTTALYRVAGFVCGSNFRFTPRSNLAERRGWWLLAATLLLLGLNKQLDLQLWLTIHGKELLRELDLYAYRRLVRIGVFIAALATISLGSLFAIPLFRAGSRRLKTAFAGLALIFSYVLLRAALFQKVALLGGHWAMLLLEPAGSLIIILTSQ